MIKIDKLENLLCYVKRVPFDTFKMEEYVPRHSASPECNSQNCIIGNWINHLILAKQIKPILIDKKYGLLNKKGFNNVSYGNTEAKILGCSSEQFTIMFGGLWSDPRFDNSKAGIIQRIEFVLSILKEPTVTHHRSEEIFSIIARILSRTFYDTTHEDPVHFTGMAKFFLTSENIKAI